jgi:hypothetical protein|eukprot:COSAG01_NODE_1630_length_9676_cov_5.955101_9_plen_45_part_00
MYGPLDPFWPISPLTQVVVEHPPHVKQPTYPPRRELSIGVRVYM